MADDSWKTILMCSICSRGGVLYIVDLKPFCPGCMKHAHPPLPYEGPERRDRQVKTPWRRRKSDLKAK